MSPDVLMTSRSSRPVIAIILAGGSGTRFGAKENKVLVTIAGRPVLRHCLEVFLGHPSISAIIVVHRAEDADDIETVLGDVDSADAPPIHRTTGGATRQDSEWCGLHLAQRLSTDDAIVLIHDAARPLVTAALIDRIVEAIGDAPHSEHQPAKGVIPGLPLRDAIVGTDGRLRPSGQWIGVQTPQAFVLGPLIAAYARARDAGFSGVDTAETVQQFSPAGADIVWVRGEADNIKVTLPDDGVTASALLERASHHQHRTE